MNKTFNSKNDGKNACVGNNGNADFMTYSEGYDEMVRIGLEKITTAGPMDVLIYPLIYLARHRIELFLKHQIIKIDFIKNKLLSNNDTKNVYGTHSIADLWTTFKTNSSFDTRYIKWIDLIEEYIYDYPQIDDTGEVFRYPETKDGVKHLENVSVINIGTFEKRYLELSEVLGNLDYFTSFLITEYQQKTFTKDLSRDLIYKLAKDLPIKNSWSKEETNFNAIKEKLMTKYAISSNTLSKAIDIIKSNFEFSSIIGCELVIEEITSIELTNFTEIYNSFLNERLSKDYNYNSNYEKHSVLIKDKISEQAIQALSQLYDIGYFRLYPEEYEKGLQIKQKEDIDNLIRTYLLRNGIVLEKINYGLKICHQTTLLKVLENE